MAPFKNNQDFSSEFHIQHAHDRFFRESMQDIEIVLPLAFLLLPSKVQSDIDWATVEIVKASWLDENLREHRSDVIYRAKNLSNDQWVYLLFEHKSTSEKKIHFQLLRYIIDIWDQHEKQNGPGDFLPLVIPIVVCHCKKPCKFDNSIKSNIAIINGAEEVIPDFRLFMLDLWFFEPEQIEESLPTVALQRTGKVKMLLLALKYSRSSEAWNILPQIIRISEKDQKAQKWKYDYLKVVLLYLASVINKGFIDQFWKIVAKEHSGGEVYMETIADVFREEERLKREKAEREVAELRKEIKQKEAMIERKDTELKEEHTELEQKDNELEKKNEQLYRIIQGMLKKGMDQKTIEEITGLGSSEIKQIINSL